MATPKRPRVKLPLKNTTKRVGRPPKTNPDDPESIKGKIQSELNSFGAKCADNLSTLFDVIYETATVKDSGTSKTNQLSAAKYCLEYAVKYLEGSEQLPEGGKKENDKGGNDDTPPVGLR